MKKTIVEYNAYLSYLCKLEENAGLDELEIDKKYNLKGNACTIKKCAKNFRNNFGLTQNSYYIEPVLRMKTRYLSELAYDETSILGIEVNDETVLANIPYTSVYQMDELNIKGIYKRDIENIYLLKALETIEQYSLSLREKKAYRELATGNKYAIEELENNHLTLTSIHGENIQTQLYYLIGEDYPECLESLVSYYKAVAPGEYVLSELPQRKVSNNSVFKRNRIKNK